MKNTSTGVQLVHLCIPIPTLPLSALVPFISTNDQSFARRSKPVCAGWIGLVPPLGCKTLLQLPGMGILLAVFSLAQAVPGSSRQFQAVRAYSPTQVYIHTLAAPRQLTSGLLNSGSKSSKWALYLTVNLIVLLKKNCYVDLTCEPEIPPSRSCSDNANNIFPSANQIWPALSLQSE